jgi:hypothetical protein
MIHSTAAYDYDNASRHLHLGSMKGPPDQGNGEYTRTGYSAQIARGLCAPLLHGLLLCDHLNLLLPRIWLLMTITGIQFLQCLLSGEFPIPLRVGEVVAGEAEIKQLWWGEKDPRKIAPIF